MSLTCTAFVCYGYKWNEAEQSCINECGNGCSQPQDTPTYTECMVDHYQDTYPVVLSIYSISLFAIVSIGTIVFVILKRKQKK